MFLKKILTNLNFHHLLFKKRKTIEKYPDCWKIPVLPTVSNQNPLFQPKFLNFEALFQNL